MIYLIGGPPRIGKSILSAQICRMSRISVVSTDSLGAALEAVLTPEAEPDLFVVAGFNELSTEERIRLMMDSPGDFIGYLILESRVIWRGAEAFIAKEHAEGRDVLIEGAAVLPELVSQLQGVDYRVVIIGNQGSAHIENIRRSAKENRHDWMGSMSAAYIEAFATVVNRMSAYLEVEAKRFGLCYLEMDQRPFPEMAELISESLGLLAQGTNCSVEG